MNEALALRDIHLPQALSWWPPAIGWWLLLIIIPLLIMTAWSLYTRFTRKTVLKSAKVLLAELQARQDIDDLQTLQQLSVWLRRVAVSIDKDKDKNKNKTSAGLTGLEWLHYLDNSVEGHPFSDGIGQCFAQVQYRQSLPHDIELSALFELCERWLKGLKP